MGRGSGHMTSHLTAPSWAAGSLPLGIWVPSTQTLHSAHPPFFFFKEQTCNVFGEVDNGSSPRELAVQQVK